MPIQSAALAICLSVALLSCHKSEDTELEAYLNSIRQSRMTVEAQGMLNTVAEVRIGLATIQFTKEELSGTYSTSFSSLTCPVPGADSTSVAKMSAHNDSLIQAEIERLRPLVDSNNSGFITTEEANEFNTLFNCQLLARQIADTEHGRETDFVKAKRLTPDRLTTLRRQYAELSSRASKLHVSEIAPWPFP